MLKRYYTLCGDKLPQEPWVQLIDEVPALKFVKNNQDLISTTHHPFRYAHQIPKRWLERDPGFKILLRAPSPKLEIFPWVLGPAHYSFRSLIDRSSDNLMIITHHTQHFPLWDELCQRFLDFNISWSGYALPALPNWPREKYVNPYDCLFHENLDYGCVFDLNFWQGDTMSPLHLHLIQNGATLLNHSDNLKISPLFSILGYGFVSISKPC